MSTPVTSVERLVSTAASSGAGKVFRVSTGVLLWMLATLIATFFATIQADSALVGDFYVPRTNDSFYHAWRILDAALGHHWPAAWDARLDPPDGRLIPWPWGYDLVMAKLTELALWLRPGSDPMAFLSYVPVAWIGVNAALFLGAAGAAGLSMPLRALAMLAFALSPLTQLLHSVAMLDHHYVEFTFILATSWLGMAWLARPGSRWLAAGLGILLGAAPAFHVGLFLLQTIPLATIAILWLRGMAPPRVPIIAFAVALVVTTQLILLPSEPYRLGMFDYRLLSWFHLYVSAATAILAVLAGWRPFSQPWLAVLGAAALVLAIPLLTNLLNGAGFVTGQVSILAEIAEARSPFRFDGETLASSDGISYYSWLLLAAPAVLLWYAWRILTETRPPRLYFAVAAVLGLTLLSLQFRFHYFGLLALVAGGLLIVDDLRRSRGWHAGMVFVGAFLVLTLAYQPPLRERLFTIYAAGADPDYQYAMAIYFKLGEVCAEDPGLVLANNDDGNPILFHSNCSVIANNFILGPEDDARFARIGQLMRSTPDALLRAEPPIRYLFVRAEDFGRRINDRLALDPSSPIVRDLLLAETLPEGFEQLLAIDGRTAPDAPVEPHARLYRLSRPTNLR